MKLNLWVQLGRPVKKNQAADTVAWGGSTGSSKPTCLQNGQKEWWQKSKEKDNDGEEHRGVLCKKQAFFVLRLNCGWRQVTQAAKELQKEKTSFNFRFILLNTVKSAQNYRPTWISVFNSVEWSLLKVSAGLHNLNTNKIWLLWK